MTEIKNEKDKSIIPKGPYCYRYKVDYDKQQTIKYTCPYWSIRSDKQFQQNGYCSYLEEGDWNLPIGFDLLWDKIKLCGINECYD